MWRATRMASLEVNEIRNTVIAASAVAQATMETRSWVAMWQTGRRRDGLRTTRGFAIDSDPNGSPIRARSVGVANQKHPRFGAYGEGA